jgi:hypothetical protein
MDVPVQYYQSVIAIEMAVAGALLFQVHFFDTDRDSPRRSGIDPRVRLLFVVVLTATLFGSLEAIREGAGTWAAVLVTVGLAVSLLPILLGVMPSLRRDLKSQQGDPHYRVTVLALILYAGIVAVIVSID